MKKLFVLLTMLIVGIGSSWGDPVTELTDKGCYTMRFVSYDGSKTWGISSSTTNVSLSEDASSSVFVAHKYTNEQGQERWIFVNNTDGYYLAYQSATQKFNISKPVNEFFVGQLSTSLANVDNNADCTDKLYIIVDSRASDDDTDGCYTLKESTGKFDNSTAPFYKQSNNVYYTSALYFTASDEQISNAASLAIAKFDALYAVKSYIPAATNMSALFDATYASTLESMINGCSSPEGDYSPSSIEHTFLKAAEGKKFYAVSNEDNGQYLNVDNTRVTATSTSLSLNAVVEAEYAGAGKYYLKGVNSGYYVCAPVNGNTAPNTVSSKDEANTFYIGNYANTTNNVVYFSKTRVGSSTIEAIHYNSGKTHKTCGWGYDGGGSQWKITYISNDEYIAMQSASPGTISYTLTDENGATYNGTYEGIIYDLTTDKGDLPNLGCYNCTFSNEVWDASKMTFTANITFPFSVSSNNVTKWIYLYNANDKFKWYVESKDATRIVVQQNNVPKYSNYECYEWAVYPSISNTGSVTFTIKNHSANKYITSSSTARNHTGTVTLTETGTSLTYIKDGSYPRWCLPTTLNNDGQTKLELSFNSPSSTGVQEIGTWTVHDGTASWSISDIEDFATLYSNLNTAFNAFVPYYSLIGDGLGKYSGATATSMVSTYDNIIGGADPTAADMRTWKTTLENPASKLTLNQPTAGQFLRIKGATSGKYVTYGTTDSKYAMGDDAEKSIFYYDGNHLLSYSDGIYWGVTADSWNWTPVGGTGATYTFLESNTIGKYFVSMPTKAGYAYCLLYDNTNNCDRGATNNLKDVTAGRYTWSLEEVTSLPLSTNGDGYTTFSAPVPVEIPDNCKAYIATGKGDGIITMVRDKTGSVAANTGLVISTGGEARNLTFNIAASGTDHSEDNLLIANVAANNVDKTKYYFFGKVGSDYVFTKISGGGTRTLYGHKAYLDGEKLPTEARISVLWGDENPTGISEMNEETTKLKDGKFYQNGSIVVVRNGVKYNIAGQLMK